MDTSQDASRLEESAAHTREDHRQQIEVSQNQSHINIDLELSPGPAWSQQNILSLDGGGIRGYWTLLVIQYLMQCIAKEEIRRCLPNEKHHSFYPEEFPANVTQGGFDDKERQRQGNSRGSRISTSEIVNNDRKYLPCHYFDYICGSSTGALIAIMLGRFRMPVWDCLQEYENMGNLIFGRPRIISQRNIGIVPWEKYSAKALEKAFKQVTADRCEKSHNNVTFKSSDSSPRICRTFVTSFAYEHKKGAPASISKLCRLRTYKNGKKGLKTLKTQLTNTSTLFNEGKDYGSDWPIWQVARAATAAPMYFKELPEKLHMRDGEKTVYFSDGGFGQTNNPTYEGISEIKALHGDDNLGAVVSIGTSRSKLKAGGKSIFKRAAAAAHIATDPQAVAEKVQDMNLSHYWRFNDEEGIEVQLDDWKPNSYFTKHPGIKTLTEIKNKFRKWALEQENCEQLNICARELVRRRRARIMDPVMWKIYATDASFGCHYDGCRIEFSEDYEALIKHFREDHSVPEVELQANIDRATKMWQYQDAS